MINDVVIHDGPLRIATGTFVCMVGNLDKVAKGGPEHLFYESRVIRPKEFDPTLSNRTLVKRSSLHRGKQISE